MSIKLIELSYRLNVIVKTQSFVKKRKSNTGVQIGLNALVSVRKSYSKFFEHNKYQGSPGNLKPVLSLAK